MRTILVLLLVCLSTIVRADDPPGRLAELATVTHKQAQQTKDPKKYEEAAGYYERYFAKPDDKEATMAFYYGELLFKLQRYEKAAEMYERSVAVDPKSKYADEAAYAAMISSKNALGPEPPPDAGAPCPDGKQCAIPPNQQKLVAAFDLYLKTVSASPERPNVEYRKARVYYEYNHFAEAAPLFDHIVAAYPDHELATYAANLEMDCLASLKRYRDLRTLVERVKKSPVMKDATTQQQVRDVEAQLKTKGK